MAISKSGVRKPRIRKSAPTVRELTEAKQPEPKRKGSRLSSLLSWPFRLLGPVWRPFEKLVYWLAPTYFRNSWKEVRQVTWPSRRETWRLTLAVFIFAAVFGTIVYGVDVGLDKIFKKVVLK